MVTIHLNLLGLQYTGSFANNLFHGNGKLKLLDDTEIQGRFEKGIIYDKGVIIFKNGDVYNGEISNNKIGAYGILKYKVIYVKVIFRIVIITKVNSLREWSMEAEN